MSAAPASTRLRFQSIAIAVTVAGLALLIVSLVGQTDGRLFYLLDDPYIHLSLAENILSGHYGINPGENASPSSSILYPFLLVPLLAFGLGDFAALALNLIGVFGSVWIIAGLIADAFADRSGRFGPMDFLIIVATLIAINAFALPLVGMEHTLHVYASLAILNGLIRLPTNGVGVGLILGIIAAPLLRFEGFALSGAALIALVLWGYWARAILIGVVIAAILAAYVATMTNLGLPILPSSVMVKSSASAAAVGTDMGGAFSAIVTNLQEALAYRQAKVLAIGAALLMIGLVALRPNKGVTTAGFVALAAAIAHLAVGRYDWYSRYEIYIIATMLAALFSVWGPALSALSKSAAVKGVLAVAIGFSGYSYLLDTLRSPAASRGIYTQQFQMHRFATEFYPHTVAINDLGWMSYRNETHVVDLWGLGSEEVRKLKAEQGIQADWIDAIAREKGAVYAMIYDFWFDGQVPETWCKIGSLSAPSVFAGHDTVSIFLIDPPAKDSLTAALAEFSTTVPTETEIAIFGCAPHAMDS